MREAPAPALARRLDALTEAIELFALPAALFDVDGLCLASNSTAKDGSAAHGLANDRFGDVIPPRTRELARAQFARCVGSGEPVEFETLVVKAPHHEVPVRLRLLPLGDADDVIGVLALAYEAFEEAVIVEHLKSAPTLTRRQHEILTLLASAHSTADIAERLGLAIETVRNHVRALLRELHAHSRLEAVVAAERLGLLPPAPYRAR